MANIMIGPAKYVQGRGVLGEMGSYAAKLGKKFLGVISPAGFQRVGAVVRGSFAAADCEVVLESFSGQCIFKDIEQLAALCGSQKCDGIVGIGGGKIMDCAKAAAYLARVPVMIAPTVASTDAPCSALAIVYGEQGGIEKFLFLPKNPDIVLVDCEIIAGAPVRTLVAGMGDALSTYIEAKASAEGGGSTCAGGQATLAAVALARLCYETLLADGLAAKLAVERQVCTKAVEHIIEANTLLSGIGFESGGLCAAHTIGNGLDLLEEGRRLYHGEKVAFGALAQLVLENAPPGAFEEAICFCMDVGLPTTLADLGIVDGVGEKLMKVARIAAGPNESIHNLPMDITPETVYAALLGLDALGGYYRKKRSIQVGITKPTRLR
jgi:glycerol dehydrogenase